MPIAYRIESTDGTSGYQIMDDNRVTLGLFTANGAPWPNPGDYHVYDDGGDPLVGLLPLPSWATTITDPPPAPTPVPQTVSPYQARIALLNAGLLDAVNALVANPSTPRQAVIAWEYATVIERYSPFISSLAPALSLNDAQVDALFIAAAQVTDN